MRFPYQLFVCLLLFSAGWTACSSNANEHPEHQRAVAWNEGAVEINKSLKKKVKELEEENEDLEEVVTRKGVPEPEVLRRLQDHQALVADYRGVIKKHELLIEQNEENIDRHENEPLGADEITSIHEQIYRNFITIQQDAARINEEIDGYLALYESLSRDYPT